MIAVGLASGAPVHSRRQFRLWHRPFAKYLYELLPAVRHDGSAAPVGTVLNPSPIRKDLPNVLSQRRHKGRFQSGATKSQRFLEQPKPGFEQLLLVTAVRPLRQAIFP